MGKKAYQVQVLRSIPWRSKRYAGNDGRLGVCNAYATLTCYLGRCLGLDILYEGGDTWNDSHAWNLVKINNEWYYADPTNMILDGDTQAFLQGNDWLKCMSNKVDDQFKDYKEKYNISDISYGNRHSSCNGEHNWIEAAISNGTQNQKRLYL